MWLERTRIRDVRTVLRRAHQVIHCHLSSVQRRAVEVSRVRLAQVVHGDGEVQGSRRDRARADIKEPVVDRSDVRYGVQDVRAIQRCARRVRQEPRAVQLEHGVSARVERAGAVAVDMRVTAEEGHGCERGEIIRIVHFFGRPHGRGGRERRGGAKIRRQRPMSRGISVYCVVSLEIARPLREETSRSASGVMTRGGRGERRYR